MQLKNIKTGSKISKMINFFSKLSPGAEKMLNEIKEEEIDPEKLNCTKSDGKIFNFNIL